MSTSLRKLVIKSVQWESGELFAMIVDVETHLPLFDPTVFAMVELRGRHLAYATIKQAMQAIRILIQFMDAKKIDLFERIHQKGVFFDINHIEQLAAICKLPQPQIDEELRLASTLPFAKAGVVTSIEKFRRKPHKNKTHQVGTGTTNIRINYICRYLKWYAQREIFEFAGSGRDARSVRSLIESCLVALKSRQVNDGNRNVVGKKKGVRTDIIARIHEVVDPNSPENPWRGTFNRYRNRLYVYWLLDLAIRKGEALGLTIEDIIFSEEKANILRRPDNPNDPRGIYAPSVKTRDRVLVLGDDLLAYTEEYLEMRREFVNCGKHGYLFVSGRNGDPLSSSAARDIFLGLRKKISDLPKDLTAHTLRHTWNSLFTTHAFATGMSDQTRNQTLRNQNGWSDTSRMPDYYSSSAIEKKAQDESLRIQKQIHALSKKF